MAPTTRGRVARSTLKQSEDSDRGGKNLNQKKEVKSINRIEKKKKLKTSSNEMTSNGVQVNAKKTADRKPGRSKASYWLMKAEPESRLENGIDVKFSIDDLAAATEPEGWDGVRNYVARNNMRTMKKGDQAFFYHSNCKVPGIVGIMEIVNEHSVDKTAHDPSHPYFDPKDSAENSKWSLVHVEFRKKFPRIVPLKELQKFKSPGQKLEHMQVLRQSRLSVSKVSSEEWNFVLELAESLAGQEGTE